MDIHSKIIFVFYNVSISNIQHFKNIPNVSKHVENNSNLGIFYAFGPIVIWF